MYAAKTFCMNVLQKIVMRVRPDLRTLLRDRTTNRAASTLQACERHAMQRETEIGLRLSRLLFRHNIGHPGKGIQVLSRQFASAS